jgi:dihydroxyacetone kinase-like protein
MIDALVPAVKALRAGADAGKTLADSLRDAAEAAWNGAASTKNLIAKFGKAKFAAERTLGHQDPGATSVAMIFEGFCEGIIKTT